MFCLCFGDVDTDSALVALWLCPLLYGCDDGDAATWVTVADDIFTDFSRRFPEKQMEINITRLLLQRDSLYIK